MEPDKNIAPEAEKSKYRLKSDIDTPTEELQDLRKRSRREATLLVVAALFIIAIGVVIWLVVSRQSS